MRIDKEKALNNFICNELSDNMCGITACNIRYAIYEFMDC